MGKKSTLRVICKTGRETFSMFISWGRTLKARFPACSTKSQDTDDSRFTSYENKMECPIAYAPPLTRISMVRNRVAEQFFDTREFLQHARVRARQGSGS